MHIREPTLDDCIRRVFKKLLASEAPVSATKGEFREATGVLLEIQNPRARLSRTETRGRRRVFTALGELLWYMSGSEALSFIEYYLPKYASESDDGTTILGAYGPRLFGQAGQLQRVVQILKKRPTSRRAVVQIFDADDILDIDRKISPPCTCTLQFLLRGDKLDLIVTMRSNDAYIGLPHDVFCFTFLQEYVARLIGADIGGYKHFVGSLHIYEGHYKEAQQFLDEGYQATNMAMPSMPNDDPSTSVSHLLQIEKSLREDEVMPLQFLEALDPYWQDLARLLEAYSCKESGKIDRYDAIILEMSSQTYNSFLVR